MEEYRSIHEWLKVTKGCSGDWSPSKGNQPVEAQPGTQDKLEEMRLRMERGEPLWNKDDGQKDITDPSFYYERTRDAN